MGKPRKIRKKKSFMFTTRHYSFMSIMGILIFVLTSVVTTAAVVNSYKLSGNVDIGYGGVGLFSALLNLIGIICAVVSLGERDIYISPAIVAISLNGVSIVCWIAMIIISIVA